MLDRVRRRHRPDHPQAVPEADRAHRLRRVPLLRLVPLGRDRARAAPDPGHRPQLRLGLLARARRLGAEGLRLRRRDRAVVLGHLLFQLHQERAAAGDPRRGALPRGRRARARRGSTSTTRPSTAPAASSSSRSTRRSSTGSLNGLDDVAMTLAARGRSTSSSRRQGRRGPGDHVAVSDRGDEHRPRDWDAETYDRVSDPQYEWGDRGARAPRAGGRRDRAGRGLRLGPRHRQAARAAARGPRDRRRRLALDDREGAGAPRRPTPRIVVADLAELRARRARRRRSSRTRPSTGSSTTTASSRASTPRCGPAAGCVAQCGGAGNVAALRRGDRGGRSAARVRRALRRDGRCCGTSPRPRRPRSGSAPPASPRSGCWLEAKPVTPEQPARVHRAPSTLGPHLARLPEELRDAVRRGGDRRAAESR